MSINVAQPLKKAGVHYIICRQGAASQNVWIAHRVNFMKINDRGRCTLLNVYATGHWRSPKGATINMWWQGQM